MATTANMPAANTSQLNPRMPMNQPQVAAGNQPRPQTQAPIATMVHSTNMNQPQPTLSQSARFSQIEAARQQNLLKIQQLQQTLEAAQQKEPQFTAAQEQQPLQQVHQQHIIAKQNAIRQLQQQLQHQQQQLDRATAQQRHQQLAAAQQQQQQQQQQQMHQVNPTNNPQLRSLLQQQAQAQQQMRRQAAMMQQHPQGMRPQLSGNIPQGAMNSSVTHQPQA